jgi:hypothetical protein
VILIRGIITDCASAFLFFLNTDGLSDPLSSPTAMWENVFLLILTAFVKIALTAWTFGMMVLSFLHMHRRSLLMFDIV